MKIEIKKGKELSDETINFMADARIKEYGENSKDVKNEEQESIFFFVKDGGKIVSFGMCKPVKIIYNGMKYDIYGLASVLSVIKGKGYGKILVDKMLKYVKKKSKSAIGFFGDKNWGFYEKTGFAIKKDLCNRFFYDYGDEKKNKEEMEGHGVYYNGKDNFIKKVLSTKEIVNIPMRHW